MRLFIFFFLGMVFYSCSKNTSNATGSKFNDPSSGGFEKSKFKEQETGPGLILVKGGYFTSEEKKEVLVPSFYMDIKEVTNHNWCEYLYWTKRVFVDFPSVYENALPNELVWQENGVYNDPMLENYLRHPAFRDYPVVGVSWLQANDYCAWRTDRVNENILIREKIFHKNPNQQNEPFTTGAYLIGQYEQGLKENGQLIDLDPDRAYGIRRKDLGVRNVRIEDGLLLPKYRLPTAAEWEYANNSDTKTGKVLPWKGSVHKNYSDKNFIEQLTENNVSFINPVDAHWPNDYGLYNMNGNVSEWVLDSYVANKTVGNYSPYSGEDLTLQKEVVYLGSEKGKLYNAVYNINGIIVFLKELEKERKGKGGKLKDSIENIVFREVDSLILEAKIQSELFEEYRASEYVRDIVESSLPAMRDEVISRIDFEYYNFDLLPILHKGISEFLINKPGNIQLRKTSKEDELQKEYLLTDEMKEFIPNFDYELDELFKSDNKVFKGRNWRDTINNNGVRYLDKHLSSSTIGFRCAMSRLGEPSGLGGRNRNVKANDNNSYLEEGGN